MALEAQLEPRSVRGWVATWALPLIGVLSSTAPRDRRLARIVSHMLHDDPRLAGQFRGMVSATDARLVNGPRVDERKLWLRLTVIVSALAGLARVDALGGAPLDRAVEVPEAIRAVHRSRCTHRACRCPRRADPRIPPRGLTVLTELAHAGSDTCRTYAPTVGLSIDPDTGAVLTDGQARALHAGQNRGPMLAVSYWCEEGCRGRIELREHKGHLFACLDNEQPVQQ